MPLKKFSYCEFNSQPRSWTLEPIEFGNVNLLVGRNSTGKTRVLNVLHVLMQILSNKITTPYSSGTFDLEVELEGKIFSYYLSFQGGLVHEERLHVNAERRMTRASDGSGSIWYEAEQKEISFQTPNNSVAIQSKNDQLQHPFIHTLKNWASTVALYQFGTDLGRTQLIPENLFMAPGTAVAVRPDVADHVVTAYAEAFEKYGPPLDQAIIRDMERLGYNLTSLDTEALNEHLQVTTGPLVGFTTVERELGIRIPQFHMSQGMFRAFAIVTQLNIVIFSQTKRLLLIDDIGEGLDFERSTKLIELIVSVALANNLQVIMTTNDRFVMNNVSLDHWVVLERTGKIVKAYTPSNSPDRFNEFKYIGLSNFDFFKDVHFH